MNTRVIGWWSSPAAKNSPLGCFRIAEIETIFSNRNDPTIATVHNDQKYCVGFSLYFPDELTLKSWNIKPPSIFVVRQGNAEQCSTILIHAIYKPVLPTFSRKALAVSYTPSVRRQQYLVPTLCGSSALAIEIDR